ncbi:hypothetical protein AA313_de0201903 [Arthrobotrys entomopaga]|nr:hypothetical protein AA313_de0201903 [Arthrobotrys entomopaga]
MANLTTIDEALRSLPSSAISFTADQPSNRTTSGRQLLIKKKFSTSTSAENHRPPQLRWVVASQPHILTNYDTNNSILKEKRKIKESILITGRDSGAKQWGNDNLAKGGCLTAEDLEMDLESESSEQTRGGLTIAGLEEFGSDDILPTGKPKSTLTAHVTKRRRIDNSQADIEEYDSIPRDFLALLKSEIPGGEKYVSPGDFARVWKMSGRELSNDMVLAQNEYFGKSKSSHGFIPKKPSKGKGRGR